MKIVDIRELTVPLKGNVANAMVNFSTHTVSLVAVISDVVRGGRPLVGFAFDSIGRFGQRGILTERIIPRILAAAPDSLLDASGRVFDPAKAARTGMRDEKPGGHGDRAAAMAAVELAIWDLNAKLEDEPAHATIARHFGREPESCDTSVYAAGGYYYPTENANALRDELKAYVDLGFSAFKMKIGGASLGEDLARIEAALAVAGEGANLAVDANGRFDLDTALAYAKAIEPYGLRWFEEIGDPLDFRLNKALTEVFPGAVATGENLFSVRDVENLVRYGGMRTSKDVFQMDAGLSYGLTEYAQMIAVLESNGFNRRQAMPHGGHLINLHIVVGLGLGGCEAYPGVFQPFGGYSAACGLGGGRVRPGSAGGFGLEEKDGLRELLSRLSE